MKPLVPLLTLLWACTPPPPVPPPNDLVLRVYEVPESQAEFVTSTLNDLLWRGEAEGRLGRASVGPNGELVVAAPERFHPGVEKLVASVGKGDAVTPPRVEIEYWVVMGTSADAFGAEPRLAAIEEALHGVSDGLGGMSFSLLERVRLTGESGARAQAKGGQVYVEHVAASRGDQVVADVDVHTTAGASLQTRVVLPKGQVLVLGEAGAPEDDAALGEVVLYVVRASVDG